MSTRLAWAAQLEAGSVTPRAVVARAALAPAALMETLEALVVVAAARPDPMVLVSMAVTLPAARTATVVPATPV
jgi:hypothetical protein